MRKLMTFIAVLCGVFGVAAVPSEFLTTGDGTYFHPYVLSKAAHFAELATEVAAGETFEGKYLVLDADVDLSSLNDFQGIGTGADTPLHSQSFKGDFNGKCHTVSGLKIVVRGREATGLFNSLDKGGCVHHLRLADDCTVTGGDNTGAIAGVIWDGVVECVRSAAEVGGNTSTGGIAGSLRGGYIESCAATGLIAGTSQTGGIAGHLEGTAHIAGCYNTAMVRISGFGSCAGIAGAAFGHTDISACYNTGRIVGRPSEEFDIDPSAILADHAPFAWSGEVTSCCYVALSSQVSDAYAREFTQAEMASAVAVNYLNEALPKGVSRFVRSDSENDGYPVLAWDYPQYIVALEAPRAEKGFSIEGNRLTAPSPVSVFTASGIKVFSGTCAILPPGIYIIDSQKIVINEQ